jgi:hypothetical protein
MLYQIGIQPLTRKQILNLSKGKGVRVKAGEFIVDVDKKQYNAYNRNSRQGKAFTFKLARHHGSGFLQDAYNFIKSRPVLKRAVNYGIQTGKRYAHRGVDYLSGKAHQAVERLPMIGSCKRLRNRHYRHLLPLLRPLLSQRQVLTLGRTAPVPCDLAPQCLK